jgi:hypothetical protein
LLLIQVGVRQTRREVVFATSPPDRFNADLLLG